MEIEFTIKNQTLKQIGEPKPANKSQEFLQFNFEFTTDDWTGLTKFALFNYNGLKYRVALADDSCIVPNAVLQGTKFSFSIYGVNNDDVRATTNRVMIYLSESDYTREVENDIPDDDPTIVEQIYLDIAAAKSEAESYAKEYADAGLSGKSDVGHKHTESDITDLKDYSLVGHNHDERYYTQTEVDQIIHDLNNRMNLTSDKSIMQTDDVSDLTARLIQDGMPVNNTIIYFYKKEEQE